MLVFRDQNDVHGEWFSAEFLNLIKGSRIPNYKLRLKLVFLSFLCETLIGQLNYVMVQDHWSRPILIRS